MQKQSLFLIIILLVLITPSFAQPSSKDEVTIEGIVQKSGPSIFMQGTHELIDSKGEVIARLSLRSGSKPQNVLEPFEGKRVKLSGKWVPAVEAGGQIFEVYSVDQAVAAPNSKNTDK